MGLDSLNPLDRRNRISDMLMNYHFHIFDVSFSTPVVLTLVYGFKSVTSPEMTVNTKVIKEGTFEYRREVVQDAECAEILMTQGARYYNSDFYDWIVNTVKGAGNQKKNLLLVQYAQIATGVNVGGGTGLNLGFAPLTDLVQRIPARAWMLFDCLPKRYRASSDFDAQSPDVSLMELSVKPLFFEEFNTGI